MEMDFAEEPEPQITQMSQISAVCGSTGSAAKLRV